MPTEYNGLKVNFVIFRVHITLKGCTMNTIPNMFVCMLGRVIEQLRHVHDT